MDRRTFLASLIALPVAAATGAKQLTEAEPVSYEFEPKCPSYSYHRCFNCQEMKSRSKLIPDSALIGDAWHLYALQSGVWSWIVGGDPVRC
jgi:hypothetical protein